MVERGLINSYRMGQ